MAVYVIGGGLAGCEAAWQIAQAGIKVKLFEMKPVKFSEAHSSENLAELVCSNSLKATNIENASYSVTVCAERVALFAAVAAGHRRFRAIAVAGSSDGNFSRSCPPCGVCRQALAEFCDGNTPVILADGKGGVAEYRLDSLLPMSFDGSSMEV